MGLYYLEIILLGVGEEITVGDGLFFKFYSEIYSISRNTYNDPLSTWLDIGLSL